MQETQVQSLGWEDSLEKGMANSLQFLDKLGIKLPYVPEISYWDYSEKYWGYSGKNTIQKSKYTPIFIATLFTIART